ncbi:MAG: hypothetical protein R3B72_46000 [Polyangiaceae bacterium]
MGGDLLVRFRLEREGRTRALLPAALGAVGGVGLLVQAWLTTAPLAGPAHGAVGLALAGGLATAGWVIVQRRRRTGEGEQGRLRLALHDAVEIATVDGTQRHELPRRRRGYQLVGEGTDEGVVLELDDRRRLVLELEGGGRAQELLTAAGVDARRRCLEVPLADRPITDGLSELRSGARRRGLWLVPAVLVATAVARIHQPGGASWTFAALIVLWLWALASLALAARRLRRPPRVIVGHDGLLLRAAGLERFVSFADLQRAEVTPQGVALTAGGSPILLPLAADPGPWWELQADAADAHLQEARRAALMEALRGGLSRYESERDEQGKRSAPIEPALARSLDLDRAARTLAGGYRETTLSSSRAAELAEEGHLSRGQRVAAALVVAASGDAAAQARLRAAIEACADPVLEAALSEALRPEPDRRVLERALEPV